MKDKAIGFNCVNFILLNNVKTYIVNNKVIRNFFTFSSGRVFFFIITDSSQQGHNSEVRSAVKPYTHVISSSRHF